MAQQLGRDIGTRDTFQRVAELEVFHQTEQL